MLEPTVITTSIQVFQNVRYYLCANKYFINTQTGERLHRMVYEANYGPIGDSNMCVHHMDHDKSNNHPNNLQLLSNSDHSKLHSKSKDHSHLHTPEVRELTLRKAADWHGSEEGRQWHIKHHKENCQDLHKPRFKRICAQCGIDFLSCAIKGKFCKPYCRTKYRKLSGVDDVNRTCIGCEREFTINKYIKKYYCSRKCLLLAPK